ncbi:MAG: dTDP-glucose 4,6-dehydratase [Saprospiraceae bacterium]|nr:dTDP-glucose 4,6-dehydratase [Saprospiraceae bacterium]
MKTYDKNILITGGAGFIRSHVVRKFVKNYPNYFIVNGDALTYAGNLKNLEDIENLENYAFEKLDITSLENVREIIAKHKISDIVHLAAESHVDRSISNPTAFVQTNVLGTTNLLVAAKENWNSDDHVFYHVSTDEVYGSLGDAGWFTETTSYDPRSPYSASKAASDHIVRSFFHTYHFPIKISNCSNNYGPYQFPEKLIPLMIHNILHNKNLPVYGLGLNVRDWLWVGDHVTAIDLIFHKGVLGQTYNIGGNSELKNIEVVHLLCDIMDKKLERKSGESSSLITYVSDRPGHDLRYAIDASKIKKDLNWAPKVKFPSGLEQTVDWYLSHESWLKEVTSGQYKSYYEQHYLKRNDSLLQS